MADGDSKVVDLANLNPEFRRRMGNFLTAAKAGGIPAHIIEAYRSNAVQAQYYQDKLAGKRPYPVAPPGQSFHNYGFAADTLADDRSQQGKLIAFANQHPEFGISPLPGDAPHFQISGYRHVPDLIANPPAYGGGPQTDLSPFIAANQGYSIAKGYTPNATAPAYSGDAGEMKAAAGGFTLPANAPMGMGNNNPLNIKYYRGASYDGLVGPSANTDQGTPQMVFQTPQHGWNAGYRLLKSKYDAGLTTPNLIIAAHGRGWTPDNKQAALNIANALGIKSDEDINFDDPAMAQKFMRALVTQEQGGVSKAYPDAMIAAAIAGRANAPQAAGAVDPEITARGKAMTPPIIATPPPLPGAPTAVAAAAPPGTTLTSTPAAAAPAGPLGQVGALAKDKDFLANVNKLTGQAGQDGAQGGDPGESPFIPGPPARNVRPQGYGLGIDSMQNLGQPLQWGSGPPGLTPYANAGQQGPPGTSLASLNQLQALFSGMNANPFGGYSYNG